MLVDGRFPSGGYAHSGGLEQAIANGHVSTVSDLESFVVGRLHTTGLVAAAFAAAACRLVATTAGTCACDLEDLDTELDARIPSPAQRATSRQLGRQLTRAISTICDEPVAGELPSLPHLPIALGWIYGGLGLSPSDAALASLHEIAAGAVAAAVRLLSTDPFTAHGILGRSGPLIDELTKEAVRRSANAGDLPSAAGPMQDVNAERHVRQRAKLFAS